MKTIDEAASEYADVWVDAPEFKLHIVSNFKAGVEFAQRWIPIDEELPEKKNHGFSDKVLTKDMIGNILLERYDYEFSRFNEIRYDSKEKGDG